jgi:hypothetical protein
MLEAANAAHQHGLVEVVHPNPSNPNLFWYKVTKAGSKFAHVPAGSTKTIDVMKVLSHFGNLKLA